MEKEREEHRAVMEKSKQEADITARRHNEQMKEMMEHMDLSKSSTEDEIKRLKLQVIDLQTENERLPSLEDELLEMKATLNIKTYDFEENLKET